MKKKKMKKKLSIFMLMSGSMASLPLIPVMAQGAAAQSESAGALEEIIVTAQRREESLQKTSIAITAISGEELAAQSKYTVEEAIATIPGVQLQGASQNATPVIRGIGPAVGTESSAALSVDGVYQSDGLFGAPFDVARVEVLRGPQGTLYGRNSTAGSVNVITNDPTETLEGRAAVQVGNYDSVRAEGMLNVPVTDDLAVRAAVLSSKRSGYMSNGTQDDDTLAARVKALYEPTDKVSLLLAANYTKLGGNGPGNTQAPLSSHSDDPWRTTDLSGAMDSKLYSYHAQLDLDLGFATLTYIPAYYEMTLYTDTHLIGSQTRSVSHNEYQQHTQELRLASAPTQSFEWLVGAFYLDHDDASNPFADQLVSGTHAAISPMVTSPRETRSTAVFGQVTVPVTDTLRLIGGARYTWEDKSASTTTFSTTAPYPIISITAPFEYESSQFTYRAGLEYDVASESMLYATYALGFKAGGINSPSARTTYEPEQLKSYEIGSKNRFANDSVQLNASAYYYDYSDYQVFTANVAVTPPVIAVLNAAEATLWGVELESAFALSESDRLNLSVAYNNTEFDQFIYFSFAHPTGLDRSGESLPLAPEWTTILGYDHDFKLPGGATLSIGAQGRRYSGSDVSVSPDLDSHQPAYSLVDAHAVFTPANGHWSLRAYGNNLTNEAVRQASQEIAPLGVHVLHLRDPRVYGIGLSVQF